MIRAIGMAILLLAGPGASAGIAVGPDVSRPRLQDPTPLRQDSACRPGTLPRWSELPVYTAYSTPPRLENRADVWRAIERQYPPSLRAAGVRGATVLWLFVDRCGQVQNARVARSSRHDTLDVLALRIAPSMRFAPALRGRVPVNVWVQVPIIFGNASYVPGQVLPPTDTLRVPERLRSDVLPSFPAPPGFTGPSLLNAGAIEARLTEGYAPLRASGLAGTTTLAVRVGPDGRVVQAAIATSSGTAALDTLALSVARAMVFTPAVDSNRRYTSVTTTVPIHFRAAARAP